VGLGAAGGGCHADGARGAGSDARPNQERDLVELFSWRSAPGAADALEALIDAHQAREPNTRIFNSAAASGTKARDILDDRLLHNQPPDIFQEYVHAMRAVSSQTVGTRVALDDMFDELGLRSAIFPEILRDVTRDGHIFTMPVNVHRENALFYNRHIFAANHLPVPTSVEGFLATCRKLKAAGVIPIATANEGWIQRIMFNSLAMGVMGIDAYHGYFTGQRPADVPALRRAIDVFAEVVENYVNPDAGDDGFGWTSAVQAVFNGDAAMLLHGDWSKGYFVQLGWSDETDFGVVGAPGASGMFLYGIDAFTLAAGAHNEAGARSFLETVASPAGQVAFNRIKGSSPIRPDVPREELDLLGRETLSDLEHARIRMLVRSRPSWEEALASFTRDHDREKLLRAFLDAPPTGG
jgi:glucose/mannose transport system substrate-binding protein